MSDQPRPIVISACGPGCYVIAVLMIAAFTAAVYWITH